MRFSKLAILCIMLTFGVTACSKQGVAEIIEQYLWEKRVLLIFSDSTQNEHYKAQKQSLEDSAAGLTERDLVVWSFVANQKVSVDGRNKAHLGTPRFYDYFNVPAEGFTIILLGKDGEEKQRQSHVLPMEKLFSIIDSMPMRQREMQENL